MSRRRAARAVLAAVVVTATLVVGALVVVISRYEPNRSAPSARGFTDSSTSPTFFWGYNLRGRFTHAELEKIATTRRIAVIAPHHDQYNLRAQELDARRLKAINPKLKVLMYFNSKHYLYESRHPKYMTGFDPATMSLHDPSGVSIPYKTTPKQPDGIGYYADNTSAAWRNFYVRTARQIMAAGDFDGIAMDDLDPLAPPANAVVTNQLPASQLTAWRAGQLTLLRQVKAAFPDKIVLYNGISPIQYNQNNRDFAPFLTADAAVNEAYCIQGMRLRQPYRPSRENVLAEIAMMRWAAKQKKIILEKVNFFSEDNHAVAQRYGDLCVGGFLLGYEPGSTYFDFSSGYELDQLQVTPEDITLDLGKPTGLATIRGSTGHRSFRNGEVYVNLGSAATTVKVSSAAHLVRDGRVVSNVSKGQRLSLGPMTSAFLVDAPLSPP